MKTYRIPLLIRGELIEDGFVEFEGRRGELSFQAPDVANFIDRLPLRDPTKLADMYANLRIADVVDYLHELSKRLSPDVNGHMQEAYELSCLTSGLSPEILRYQYCTQMPAMLAADNVHEVIDKHIGHEALDGWTQHLLRDGRVAHVRPLGARCMHVIAGNSPMVAGTTVLWNCITRGDAVVKSPSNDPLTALAIGRTMIEMAPDHPLTKHYSVGYWKGGNTAFESAIYRPDNFEKIVAWGGFASMKHITKYLQPGLELIAMDPKLSGTLIGKEAFDSEDNMRDVARLIAQDFGGLNQEACASARVINVESGTDKRGLEKLKKLAEYAYEELQNLPPEKSAPHPHFDPDLRAEIASTRRSRFYTVVGTDDDRGAVIVSHLPDPVDFADKLGCRVANFVPCDDIEDALRFITIHTQTIGIYPESLKQRYRDRLAFLGGQKIVSLGYHLTGNMSLPHDGLEPIRRLCRWISESDMTVSSYGKGVAQQQECVPTG
jgi:hypothetical protein